MAHASGARRLAPVLLVLALVAALTILLMRAGMRSSGGEFAYALDDAYIHLALARNLAEHGVWGFHEFGSASSSPVWTLLLAGGAKLGLPLEPLPWILALLCAGAAILVAAAWIERAGLRGAPAAVAVLAVALAAPVPALVASGMEHALQIALSAAFLLAAARVLAGEPAARTLLLLAPALVLVRYESLFLLGPATLAIGLRGRVRLAIGVLLLGLLPPAVFALASIAAGGFAVPNGVLLKGTLPMRSAADVLEWLLGRRLREYGAHLAGVLLLALWLRMRTARIREAARQGAVARFALPAAWLWLAATALQLLYGRLGWFFRYEAWLVFTGSLVAVAFLAPFLRELARRDRTRTRKELALAALLLLLLLPLGVRIGRAAAGTPRAMRAIHDQQVQTARLLRDRFPGVPAALNDVGAPAYFSPGTPLLDLSGLASQDVARVLHAGPLEAATMAELARAHGVRIAALYPAWFPLGLPPEWIEAGAWRVPERGAAASDTVVFYAVDPALRADLERALAEEPLPAGVRRLAPGER